MKKVLIDTDVILDFFFDRKPFSNEATTLLSLCENKELIGFITPVTVSNIYYILRKTASHQKVIDHIQYLLEIIEISTINKETIMQAIKSNFSDFEDALQNYSALIGNEIKVIITRNTKDYKTSELSVMTPESYLKWISQ